MPTTEPRRVVLVIEDIPHVVQLIRGALADLSLEVVATTNGEEGLVQAAELDPTVVLLDLGLPGMDGFEVLRRLRADAATSDLPVIVVTAHADSETAAQVRALGADEFVAKPFRPSELRRFLDRYLAPDSLAG